MTVSHFSFNFWNRIQSQKKSLTHFEHSHLCLISSYSYIIRWNIVSFPLSERRRKKRVKSWFRYREIKDKRRNFKDLFEYSYLFEYSSYRLHFWIKRTLSIETLSCFLWVREEKKSEWNRGFVIEKSKINVEILKIISLSYIHHLLVHT